jgi:hypothetical protein
MNWNKNLAAYCDQKISQASRQSGDLKSETRLGSNTFKTNREENGADFNPYRLERNYPPPNDENIAHSTNSRSYSRDNSYVRPA